MTGKGTDDAAHDLRYSPIVLVVDVVRVLRGRGVAVSELYEHAGPARRASADLLRWLGVQPDDSQKVPPSEPSAVLLAAATLIHAAGIDPDAVVAWPKPATR
jgi:hypothetical protein